MGPLHPLFVYDTTNLTVWWLVHRIDSCSLHWSFRSLRYLCKISHMYTGWANVVCTAHHALCETLLPSLNQASVIVSLVRCVGPLLITVSTLQGIRVPIVLERILIHMKATSHLLGNLGVHIIFDDWISWTVESIRLLLLAFRSLDWQAWSGDLRFIWWCADFAWVRCMILHLHCILESYSPRLLFELKLFV